MDDDVAMLWELSNGDMWQLDPLPGAGMFRITNVTADGSLVARAKRLHEARELAERYLGVSIVEAAEVSQKPSRPPASNAPEPEGVRRKDGE